MKQQFPSIVCVYRLNFPDGSFYIGSMTNYNQRMQNYKHKFNRGKWINALVSRKNVLFDEIGLQILEEVAQKDRLKQREQYYISLYISDVACLNRSASSTHNTVLKKPKNPA